MKVRVLGFVLVVGVLVMVIFGWYAFHGKGGDEVLAAVAKDSPCVNESEREDFEKAVPIVWMAKLDGCLAGCYGAYFSKVSDQIEEYPRFAGYYLDTLGNYDPEGGVQIPEKFLKDGLLLKVYGKWIGIQDDHPYTIFNGECVPIVDIEKIEILN